MKHARKILEVRGNDREKFLNDLLTIEISADMPLRYGALLTPQGKIICDLFVFARGDALLVDLPECELPKVLAKLNFYKLRADVALNVLDEEVWQVEGEGDPRGAVDKRHYGALGQETPLGEAAYTARRVAAIVPEFGVDFGADEAYPIEWRFGEMGGIDYRKGCYVGQEIAARMRHKTELQKTLLRFKVEGVADYGAPIMADGKEAGKLLSQSGGLAIGFVRLKRLQGALTAGAAKLTMQT